MKNSPLLLFLKIILCLTIFWNSPILLHGQGEANTWLFGNSVGLDFNHKSNSRPAAIINSAMSAHYGTSSISDKYGKLLFYSDGITVWNAEHTIMSNGTNLGAVNNSAQSSIIIPNPGNANLYYIITVDKNNGQNGFQWSAVDMTLENGLGEIISKNNLLLKPACQKITTVLHSNGKDIWIIGHAWDSNSFYAWLVDDNSISNIPIISNIGLNISHLNGKGHLKSNLAGDKISFGYSGSANVQIFDFDNETGVISNPITLDGFNIWGINGLEFSPSGRFLYVTDGSQPSLFRHHSIYQFDLSDYNQTSIQNSREILATGNGQVFKALQLGVDGIIYVSGNNNALGAIRRPEQKGINCLFNPTFVGFPSGEPKFGLPNIPSFFLAKSFFETQYFCFGDPVLFNSPTDTITYDSLQWNFGDVTSGDLNSSILPNPSHFYQQEGVYEVVLKRWKNGNPIETKSYHVSNIVDFDFSNKQITCFDDNDGIITSLPLRGVFPFNYQWNIGGTSYLINNLTPNEYSVTITDALGCTFTQETVIQSPEKLNATLEVTSNNNISTAYNKNIILSPIGGTPPYTYLWNTGDTTKSLFNIYAGEYAVTIIDQNGCEYSEHVLIESSATGMEDLITLNKIQIFPNPVNEILVIETPPIFKQDLSITMINLSGQIIFENFILEKDNPSINVSSIPNGFYFLEIKINEEEKIWKISIIR